MKGYIYRYTYPNGKVYVGQTMRSLKQRHYEHMWSSKHPEQRRLCETAIAKYGEPTMDVLETIEVADGRKSELTKRLNDAEKRWISELGSTNKARGYNIQNGGETATTEEFILQEKWYDIFDSEGWGYGIGYFKELLQIIGGKLCMTGEKLTKEENRCWYGYKFTDGMTGKETTFNSYYKRRRYGKVAWDAGDLPDVGYYVLEGHDLPDVTRKKVEHIIYKAIMREAVDNWIEDIRQTIWRKVMAKKETWLKEGGFNAVTIK